MIAFQVPPFAQSTGRLRSMSFVRHLPESGWQPIVVTARRHAYSVTDERTLVELPEGVQVVRAWGGDISRWVSVRGVYPRWVCTPDRWNTWALGAFFAGRRLIRSERPDLIWATFPIPSALLAAWALHRHTRLPLVVDLRDPMVYENWPVGSLERSVYGWLERQVFRSASAVILTTPGARDLYTSRYPDLPASRFSVVANGIDEEMIANAGRLDPEQQRDGPVLLLHSGLMESPDRDPTAFFKAVRLLAVRGQLPECGLRIVLRASGRTEQYGAVARSCGVESMVELAPSIPRAGAIQEIAKASGLLLFQGRECNRQIPAKAYEYLASRRPIIGLMHPLGNSHALLKEEWGVPYVADMDSPEQIAAALVSFFADIANGRAYVPPAALIPGHSRQARAVELARIFDHVTADHDCGKAF